MESILKPPYTNETGIVQALSFASRDRLFSKMSQCEEVTP